MGKHHRPWTNLMRTQLRLCGVLVLLCAGLSAFCADVAKGTEPAFILGMGMHISGGKRPLVPSLTLLHQVGVDAIRDDVYWTWVEKLPGVLQVPPECDAFVQAALERGIQPLIVLGYGDPLHGGGKPHDAQQIQAYVSYARAVVEHFRGKVHLYELWNEWDWKAGGTEPGSTQAYLALISAAYPVLKRADPGARFLIGAVTTHGIRGGFLESLVRDGGLRYGDGLSLHTYTHHDADPRPEAWAAWMSHVEDELKTWSGKGSIPFYVTEMGWPSYSGSGGVSASLQARYLARMFMLARTLPFIEGVWWYDFQDDGEAATEMEQHFGVVDHSLHPKPAYAALAAVAHLLSDASYEGRLQLAGSDLVGLRFRLSDGKRLWAVWEPDDGQRWKLRVAAAGEVTLRQLEDDPSAGDKPMTMLRTGSGPYSATLTVGSMPVLLSGELTGLQAISSQAAGKP